MDAFIVEAIRTPRGRGSERGALHSLRPVELVATVLEALTERIDLDPTTVRDVILGCVGQVGDQGANIAKTALVWAGWPDGVSGQTVNRFCASGLDAIAIAATAVAAGGDEVAIGGGVEMLSRVPMRADRGAWFGDTAVAERTGYVDMPVAADLLAARHGFSRDTLDAFTFESHERAAAAATRPAPSRIDVRSAGAVRLDREEVFRPVSPADLAALPALRTRDADSAPPDDAAARARYPDVGPVPPRHSFAAAPKLADAASVALLADEASLARHGLRPRARIRAVGKASVEPVEMLTGNVPATQRALARAGLRLEDVDVFEVNESFAAVPIHYTQTLQIDPARLNPNGGALALGHPLGATGGILISTLLDELERRDGRIGVASICGGAGVATAIVLERV